MGFSEQPCKTHSQSTGNPQVIHIETHNRTVNGARNPQINPQRRWETRVKHTKKHNGGKTRSGLRGYTQLLSLICGFFVGNLLKPTGNHGKPFVWS